jgi:hypothetical protein
MSYPECPVMAVPSRFPRPSCPVLAGRPAFFILSSLYYFACLPGCPVTFAIPAVCPGCPVQRPCPNCLAPALMSQAFLSPLSCPCCHVLAVLSLYIYHPGWSLTFGELFLEKLSKSTFFGWGGDQISKWRKIQLDHV